MLIDLHCHTLPASQCSALQPEELVDLARERGLDGVCLTEHDRPWDPAAIARLRRRTAFLVLSGVEYTTDAGHVLAYGTPPAAGPAPSLRQLAARATAAGGILYLAHPARDGLLRVDRHTVECFASVEAINGSDSRIQNLAATGLAKGFRLPGIGGSDAHRPAEAGRAATLFKDRISDQSSLLRALHAGRYEPVALDD